jgi:hypothetical protein
MSFGSSNLGFEFSTRLMFFTFATVRGTVRGLSLRSAISVVNIIDSAATLYVGCCAMGSGNRCRRGIHCSLPLAARAGNSDDDANQKVLDLRKEWADAELKHDAARLRRMTNSSPPSATTNHTTTSFHQRNTQRRDGIANADRGDGGSRPRSEVVVGADTVRGKHNSTAYTAESRYTMT